MNVVTRVQPDNQAAGSAPAFAARLPQIAAQIDTLLGRLLDERPNGEAAIPPRLLEAMRYACLGQGKRFRPFLVVETAALFGVSLENALMTGAALECVHCYSLVHDDLPAMDDDELRRGRPTVHRRFDEATAILAGDGLLTFAFDILSRPETSADPAVRVKLISSLALAAGPQGMVGGQMLDLAAEGRFGEGEQAFDEAHIRRLQGMKTGALIRFAASAGAILAAVEDERCTALQRYGALIGEAFQIADDLLDIEGEAALLGKAVHKDAEAGKATLAGLLGVEPARKRLASLTADAHAALEPFGTAAVSLKEAAEFVANRRL